METLLTFDVGTGNNYTISEQNGMNIKKIATIRVLEQVQAYLDELEPPAKKKFAQIFRKVEFGFKGKWFEKLHDTDGIFEFRVSMKKTLIVLFAFWDTTADSETLIICTHGINRKTQKTSKGDIERAEKVKKDYFGDS